MIGSELKSIFQKNITVSVSEDHMEAYIMLSPPPMNNPYTIDEVKATLRAYGVIYGVNESIVADMVKSNRHNESVLIALGQPSRNGENGYFEYLFKQVVSHAPKILEDGSIDFRTIELVEPVNKGDVIAIYHPAIDGADGRDVYGNRIPALKGKELPIIFGSGFTISEDKQIYTANFNGKVELINEKLFVTSLLLIEGDTDNSTGDIRFCGDVVIKGSVNYGYSIYAEGSVTVCGSVEAAKIVAGHNVELRNGMQGGGKGSIECLGNVSGKFFEQVNIQCRGDLTANSILHCNIHAEGKVIATGRHGIIVGGVTEAICGIQATVLGNVAEAKTRLSVGNFAPSAETIELQTEVERLTEELKRIDDTAGKLKEFIERSSSIDLISKLREMVSLRENIEEQLNEKQKDYTDLLEYRRLSQQASIRVTKYLYPEVFININGVTYQTTDTFKNLTVKAINGEIKLFSSSGYN